MQLHSSTLEWFWCLNHYLSLDQDNCVHLKVSPVEVLPQEWGQAGEKRGWLRSIVGYDWSCFLLFWSLYKAIILIFFLFVDVVRPWPTPRPWYPRFVWCWLQLGQSAHNRWVSWISCRWMCPILWVSRTFIVDLRSRLEPVWYVILIWTKNQMGKCQCTWR